MGGEKNDHCKDFSGRSSLLSSDVCYYSSYSLSPTGKRVPGHESLHPQDDPSCHDAHRGQRALTETGEGPWTEGGVGASLMSVSYTGAIRYISAGAGDGHRVPKRKKKKKLPQVRKEIIGTCHQAHWVPMVTQQSMTESSLLQSTELRRQVIRPPPALTAQTVCVRDGQVPQAALRPPRQHEDSHKTKSAGSWKRSTDTRIRNIRQRALKGKRKSKKKKKNEVKNTIPGIGLRYITAER